MKEDVHANDHNLEAELLLNNNAVDESIASEHADIHERFLNEEKMFTELRHEFNRFAAEWL